MKNFPVRDKRAKTGSNLRSDLLRSHREKLLAARLKPLKRLGLEYQRQCKKLLSKADLRLVAGIAGRVEAEWHESNLQGDPDAERWRARKTAARARLDRELARALPQYRQWQALRRNHLREYRKLTALGAGSSGERWNVVAPPAAGPVAAFIAPFTTYDIETIDIDDYELIENDQSFVSQDSGYIINNLDFRHDEDTAIMVGIFGLDGIRSASGLASCGVNFRMPQAGRLHVTAELQSIHNRVTLSLEDSFGFSAGQLDVTLSLFIAFVLPTTASQYSKVLFTQTLTSEGDDESSRLPDTEELYKWSRTSEESFPQGETVRVLAGCEVHTDTRLDDMEARVDALLWWQLKRLTIGVV